MLDTAARMIPYWQDEYCRKKLEYWIPLISKFLNVHDLIDAWGTLLPKHFIIKPPASPFPVIRTNIEPIGSPDFILFRLTGRNRLNPNMLSFAVVLFHVLCLYDKCSFYPLLHALNGQAPDLNVEYDRILMEIGSGPVTC